MVWHGEGWAPPCDIAQDSPHEMTTRKDNIPARSSPRLPRTAPSVTHQGRGVKCTTGVPNKKIHARGNTIIGTGNVKTLKNTGKLEELEHKLTRYNWNILRLRITITEGWREKHAGRSPTVLERPRRHS